MTDYSPSHKVYIQEQQKKRRKITLFRFLIGIGFLLLWELAARMEWINSFIFSSPSGIISCMKKDDSRGNLFLSFFYYDFRDYYQFSSGNRSRSPCCNFIVAFSNGGKGTGALSGHVKQHSEIGAGAPLNRLAGSQYADYYCGWYFGCCVWQYY